MTEKELVIANMLIHGHNSDVQILDLNDELIDLAVMLATNDEYEKSAFTARKSKPELVLKDSKIFLNQKFVLHKVSYADEKILKCKLHGKIIKNEKDLVNLYNKIGILIDPFDLPVSFVNKPYYYGNVSLLANLSDDVEFLKRMKIFFKNIELGNNVNDMTAVCYIHEIVHTQIESIKGIVGEYYNSEVLSIFMELLYAYEKGPILLRETLKNRINLFLIEFNSLYNYVYNGICTTNDGLWYNIMASKYIVSTAKALHLFNNYCLGNNIEKSNILWNIQKVFMGISSLEDILQEMDIYYENSLEGKHVLSLINCSR